MKYYITPCCILYLARYRFFQVNVFCDRRQEVQLFFFPVWIRTPYDQRRAQNTQLIISNSAPRLLVGFSSCTSKIHFSMVIDSFIKQKKYVYVYVFFIKYMILQYASNANLKTFLQFGFNRTHIF